MPIPTGDTQVCRDCRQELPIAKFSRSGRKDGFRRPECRKCQHTRSKEINPNYMHTQGSIKAREAHNGIPREEKNQIKKERIKSQGGECIFCTEKLDELKSHLDHKIPLARGGNEKRENFQLLCPRCNLEKSSKTNDEYIAWLKELGEHLASDRRGKI